MSSDPATVLQALRAEARQYAALERAASPDEARAAELRSERATRWLCIGAVYQTIGDDAAAERAFRRALRLAPAEQAHLARVSLGWLQLSRGDFRRGWSAWAWLCGWATQGATWDGQPRPGRTITLSDRGGYGDVLMFCRYAALARERVGAIQLACRPPLARLLATVHGVDSVVPRPPEPGGLWAPVIMLPVLLKAQLETIPASPYLQPNPVDVARWRVRIGTGPGLRVGLVWATSEWGEEQPPEWGARSIHLSALAPLARVSGVRLYSVQAGVAGRALGLPYTHGLTIENLADGLSDFSQTAAALECLDLVVSVDTAVAHLAGALGRPVWVLLNQPADWRWFTGRTDSPWYSSMRLFRAEQPGAWGPVVTRVAEELVRLTRERAA